MESTTQRVQYCRKNRLEGWILLFYAKNERKHPGTRLDVMRENCWLLVRQEKTEEDEH